MKKILKCVECSRCCELIVDLTENDENYFWMKCNSDNQYWKDITELRKMQEDRKLPKLTVEVFDRPDCPDWARYAAVDKDGIGFYYQNKPEKAENKEWSLFGVDNYHHIGIFDASDWENSLIERPSKEELPDWVNVDNMGWHSETGYFKVIDVDDIEKKVRVQHINSQIKEHFSFNTVCIEAKYARPRPFNDKEMQGLVGKVIENCNYILWCDGYDKERNLIITQLKALTAEDLIKGGYTVNREPCYVLEHLNDEGEWVK